MSAPSPTATPIKHAASRGSHQTQVQPQRAIACHGTHATRQMQSVELWIVTQTIYLWL